MGTLFRFVKDDADPRGIKNRSSDATIRTNRQERRRTAEPMNTQFHNTLAGTPGSILDPAGGAGGPQTVRVVAVDDNPGDLTLLRHLLAGLHSFDFTGFHRPAEALAELAETGADILLFDFDMGSCSGIEFLEQVRAKGIDAPAILLTGHGHEELVVNALQSGFADYISKGVVSEQSLNRSIMNALEKHHLALQREAYRTELERTVEDLQRKTREIDAFYHTLAHELKTPLTAAREFASILADGLQGPVNDDQGESLALIVRACDQLRRCINDLFDVSRLETGKLHVDRKPANLGEVLQHGVSLQAHEAKEKGIDLVVRVEESPSSVALDEQRILQVVSNLVGNALKFTEPGGTITVTCGPDPRGGQRVAVSDTGQGIAEDELETIFERMYQAEGHAGIRGGMGLGLHLCRELIRLHGGEITATSELGQGSVFAFTLPLAEPRAA